MTPHSTEQQQEHQGAWTPQSAQQMAMADGIVLTRDHWTVINFVRRFFLKYSIAPGLNLLQRALCREMGDCRWNRRYIRTLFHAQGPCDACRYAGVPAPYPEGI